MIDSETDNASQRHHRFTTPSPWFTRFVDLVRRTGRVLDVACGNGRHGRLFLERGNDVLFIDRDISAIGDLKGHARASILRFDLEASDIPPFRDQPFAAVLVSNYLHRPLFGDLLAAVEPGGVLIYETFARGNETFCRPRNPDHLLRSGELLEIVRRRFQVVAYEHGIAGRNPIPGVVQRICAVKDAKTERTDGEPPVHPLCEP